MSMNISFYTARTGMIAQQQGLNIYSNNIANVNTIGFKPLRPSFAECIYTLQHPQMEEVQTGHGQYTSKTDLMWQQGGLVLSDQPLDFAIAGDDFFMTLDENGDTYLTRDGRFGISFNGEVWELVDSSHAFVLDYEGNRIEVPFMMRAIIDGKPTIVPFDPALEGEMIDEIDYVTLTDRIGIYSVDNNWGLDQVHNNRFAVTPRSGPAQPSENSDKKNGMYEQSAVDLAGDMVRIIETQRSYQLNAKAVQISDEIMKTVNNLR